MTDSGSYHILFDKVRGLNNVIHSGRQQGEQDSSNNFAYNDGILSFDRPYSPVVLSRVWLLPSSNP